MKFAFLKNLQSLGLEGKTDFTILRMLNYFLCEDCVKWHPFCLGLRVYVKENKSSFFFLKTLKCNDCSVCGYEYVRVCVYFHAHTYTRYVCIPLVCVCTYR